MNKKSHRGVAPIIATLLLVAISVVGGTMVFIVAQDAISNSQVSENIAIEFLAFKGYDLTEGPMIFYNDVEGDPKGDETNGLKKGERIAVYVQNNGGNDVTIDSIRLAGTLYYFVPNSGTVLDAWTAPLDDGILGTPANPSYVIMTKHDTLLDSGVPIIESGQQVSIVFEINRNVPPARELQFILKTTQGMEIIGTVIAGDKSSNQDTIAAPSPPGGGGCLIATATYGTELAPQVQLLRELRDEKLIKTESGSAFMTEFNKFYYSFSPIIADFEHENLVFRETVKMVITPMILSLSILNYVDMETDAEVLGYGISLILLNVGMYFVAPPIAGIYLAKFRVNMKH